MRLGRIFPILLYSIIILAPLLLPLLAPDTPHEFDMFFHLERISEFYRQLRENHLVPGWSTYLAFGFGSPVLLFNYALPYYLATLVLPFGATLLESFKFVTGLSLVGGFALMYIFLSDIISSPAALTGAAWYVWAPYFFDINQHRGAIGELVGLAIWPGIFWTTVLLFKKRPTLGFFVGTIFWALLLYAQPDLFMMIFPLWLIVIISETLLSHNVHALLKAFLSFGLSLGIMAFYLIPSFFEHQYLGYKAHEYIYTQNFVGWDQLLSQPKLLEFGLPWGALFKSIGWPFIAVVIISIFLIIKDLRRLFSGRNRLYLPIFLFMAGLGIFLLRPASTVLWDHLPMLSFITYPQRFLGLTAFSLSVCAGLLAAKFTKRGPWISVIMITSVIIFEYPFINLNYVRDSAASMMVTTPDTTDVWGEFMPKDIPEDFITNHLMYAEQPLVTVIPPVTTTPQCVQTSASISCEINLKEPATIRFRQFYFPGWTGSVDNKRVPVTMHTDGTVLLSLKQPAHTVKIEFTKTPLRLFSEFLSFIFIVLYILLGIKTIYTYSRKKIQIS